MSNEKREKVRKNLTAQEARLIADKSYGCLNDIYKVIKDCANYNRVHMNYQFDNCSEVAIKNIVSDLRDNGYIVNFIKLENGRTIKQSDFYSNNYNYVELDICW